MLSPPEPQLPLELIEAIIFQRWMSPLAPSERIEFMVNSRLVNKAWADLFVYRSLRDIHFPSPGCLAWYFSKTITQRLDAFDLRHQCRSINLDFAPALDTGNSGMLWDEKSVEMLALRLNRRDFPQLKRICLAYCNWIPVASDWTLGWIPNHVEELQCSYHFNQRLPSNIPYLFHSMRNPYPLPSITLPNVRHVYTVGANEGLVLTFLQLCPNTETVEIDEHLLPGVRRQLSPQDLQQAKLRVHSALQQTPFQQGMQNVEVLKQRQRQILGDLLRFDGCRPPSQADENMAYVRNEMHYRQCLKPSFGDKLLPLWNPSPIKVGAVGYLSPRNGSFVTLFNCFDPSESTNGTIREMSSVYGYGRPVLKSHTTSRYSRTRRVFRALASTLSFGLKEGHVRHSFPLVAGVPSATLFTEKINRTWMDDRKAAQNWFQANIGTIIGVYCRPLGLRREDIQLVVGTVDAQDYALFVSHNHPDGHVNFDVEPSSKADRKPWGRFSTSLLPFMGQSKETDLVPICSSKVSRRGGEWTSILVQRLRFPNNSSGLAVCA